MAKVTKVPLISIVVTRDGKPFIPPLNEPFAFEQSELDDVAKVFDTGAFRDLINETAGIATEDTTAAATTTATTGKTAGTDEL